MIPIWIMVVLLIPLFYFIYRNWEVCNFMCLILGATYKYNTQQIDKYFPNGDYLEYEFVVPEYDKVLFSIKKIKCENYLSPEVYSKIKEYL